MTNQRRKGLGRVAIGLLAAMMIAGTVQAYAGSRMWCDTDVWECPECYAYLVCDWCEVTGSGCNQVLRGENCTQKHCECSSGSGYMCQINPEPDED